MILFLLFLGTDHFTPVKVYEDQVEPEDWHEESDSELKDKEVFQGLLVVNLPAADCVVEMEGDASR